MNRSDPEAVSNRLRLAGVYSKKRLGQHFLVDVAALDAIVEAATISSADTVVEIGPGMGVLSERLLAVAGRVVAFELDEDMVRILAKDFPGLEVVRGDVLQTAGPVVDALDTYKVVANIPYAITTPLLKLFLEGGVSRPPVSLTLLVQKEVGKRLAAKAGQSDRGYLSVLCQYFAEVTYVRDVPKTSFWPAPEVDSAVIHLAVREQRLLAAGDEQRFLRFVHSSFTQKRKQLKNVLAGIRRISSAEMSAELTKLGWPETVRAQELTMEQWITLYGN